MFREIVLDSALETHGPLLGVLVDLEHQTEVPFDFLSFAQYVFLDIYDFGLDVALEVIFECSHLSKQRDFVREEILYLRWYL